MRVERHGRGTGCSAAVSRACGAPGPSASARKKKLFHAEPGMDCYTLHRLRAAAGGHGRAQRPRDKTHLNHVLRPSMVIPLPLSLPFGGPALSHRKRRKHRKKNWGKK